MEEIRDIKLRGAYIRSRIKDFNLGEKPNKYFLNLENYNFVSKSIKELKLDDGNIITKPEEILEVMRRFYQSLYNKKDIKSLSDSKFSEFPKKFNKLSDVEKASLDSDITIEELEKHVFNNGANKSPGPDGYTNEFYKTLWTKIKI